MGIATAPAADLYWRVDGASATLTSSNWSATGSAPYTTAWTNGSNLIFTATTNLMTYVTNTAVGNITLNDNVTVTWGAAGTFNTGGLVSTFNIGANSTLTWNGQNISTAAGTGVIKSGLGTWNLGAQGNLFLGGFTLNAGTVIVGGTNALGGGALALNGGTFTPNSNSTRDYSGKFTSMTIGGDIQFGDSVGTPNGTGGLTFTTNVAMGAADRTLTIGSNGVYSLGGNISGAGLAIAATSDSTGLIALGGTNTYTGNTSINGGILRANSAGAIPSTSNVRINGGVLELGTNAPTAFTLGTGPGQLQWLGDGGLAAFSTDKVVTLNGGAALTWGAGNFVPDGKILNLASTKSNKTLTLTNDIDLGSAIRTLQVPFGTGPNAPLPNAVLAGKLTGTGGLSISGGGATSLTGANDYSGGTTMEASGLTIGNNSALGTGLVTFNNGGILRATGGARTLANDIYIGPNQGINLQIWADSNADLTLNGVISSYASDPQDPFTAIGFDKFGPATLTLNAANTLIGTPNLYDGTVVIGNNQALGLGSIALKGSAIRGDGTPRTIANDGLLAFPFTIGGASDLTFSGTLLNDYVGSTNTITVTNTGTTTFSGTLGLSDTSANFTVELATAAGANVLVSGLVIGRNSTGSKLLKSGAGTLTLMSANTYGNTATSAATSITGGILAVNILANGGVNSGLGNSSNAAGNLVLNGSANGATLKYIGTGGSTDRLFTLGAGAAAGALDASGTGPINFTNTGSMSTTGTSNGVRTLTLTGTNTGNNTLAAVLINQGSNATSLVKTGTGKWIVSGASTYTGTTTISAGTLSASKIAVSGGNSNLGSATSAVVLGSASTQGTLSYTGASDTYTRGFTINAGGGQVEVATSGQTLTLGTGAIAAAGTFTLSGAGDAIVNSIISGAGGFAKSGSGTAALNGTQTFQGGTTITGGVLKASADSNFGTAPGSPADNLTLNGGTLATTASFALGANRRVSLGNAFGTFSPASTTTFTINSSIQNIPSQQGMLIKEGAGRLELAVVNGYSGGTSIRSGRLVVFTGGALGSGEVSLAGGTLHANAGAVPANLIGFDSSDSLYEVDYTSGQSYATYSSHSSLLGGADTVATVLAGSAAGTRLLTTSFSLTTTALNESERRSDAFSLTGTTDDVIVLQLQVGTPTPGTFLGTIDGNGLWINAVAENSVNNATLAQQGFEGSFADFQAQNGTTLSGYIGAFGVDNANHTVWAVINHPGTFALVPEPNTLLALLTGTAALCLQRRRKARVAE
jgi:fibronectin-binding autotransporter adhesin